MRIISGNFKGKHILQPKDSKTRPLKDLTKESIFNIINHTNKFEINLQNCKVLDLFSGIGSFGIECLSRGAKKVVFVENYINVVPILKKNLINLFTIKNYEILNKDIYKSDFFSKLETKFDLIFLDPPYKYKNLEILFNKIKENNILNKNGIIILHRHKKERDIFPPQFNIIEKKKYGISKIFFLNYLNQ